MKISHLRLARESVMLLITIIHLINAIMVLVSGATNYLRNARKLYIQISLKERTEGLRSV